MYKCKECGTEYEIKPDYCECGNDEFTVVAEPKESVVEKETIKSVEKENLNTAGSVKIENNYQSRLNLPKTDPISIVIFLTCLILAIIVLLLPISEKEITDTGVKNEQVETKNIPAIDKFWNNAVPAGAEKPIEPKPVTIKTVEPVKKAASQVKKSVQVQKPTTKQTIIKQKISDVSTADQAKKAEELKKKAEEETNRKAEENARKLAEVRKHAEDLQQSMADKMEYSNYKASLRNAIGIKIDFARVIGDGDCQISFKIDQSGKLVNGAFIKQSLNMTLNDAVYKAFMSSRNFNPPPRGYKNETLKLYVKFYNGNFEISLN